MRTESTTANDTTTARLRPELSCLPRQRSKPVISPDGAPFDRASVLCDIAVSVSNCGSVSSAIKATLTRICDPEVWSLTTAWQKLDGRQWSSLGGWHVAGRGREADADHNIEQGLAAKLGAPANVELLDEVERNGVLQWSMDGIEYPTSLLASAEPCRIQTTIAFPVLANKKVVAIVQLFSEKRIKPDAHVVQMFDQIGLLLGHVIERKQFERQIASISRIERSRLARQLHDELSQQLAAATILVESLKQRLVKEQSPQVEMAIRAVAALEEAKQQSRELSNLVMPIGAEGESIVAALAELAQHARSAGVHCLFECRGPMPPIDRFTADQLVDFTGDAICFLRNGGRAGGILIELITDGGLALVIRGDDSANGRRFDEQDDLLQILRIRARLIDGKFSIESSESGCTRIACILAADVNHYAGIFSPQNNM